MVNINDVVIWCAIVIVIAHTIHINLQGIECSVVERCEVRWLHRNDRVVDCWDSVINISSGCHHNALIEVTVGQEAATDGKESEIEKRNIDGETEEDFDDVTESTAPGFCKGVEKSDFVQILHTYAGCQALTVLFEAVIVLLFILDDLLTRLVLLQLLNRLHFINVALFRLAHHTVGSFPSGLS